MKDTIKKEFSTAEEIKERVLEISEKDGRLSEEGMVVCQLSVPVDKIVECTINWTVELYNTVMEGEQDKLEDVNEILREVKVRDSLLMHISGGLTIAMDSYIREILKPDIIRKLTDNFAEINRYETFHSPKGREKKRRIQEQIR